MAVDERSRRELYESLEATLVSRSADTAMSLLLPAGWADVATKTDVHQAVELSEQRLRNDVQHVLNTITWRLSAVVAAAVGIVLSVLVPFVAQ
jgi:hypothetical protein